MNFYYRLAPALIGVSIALVQPHVAVALSATEVSKIAKEVTVQIQSQKPKYGSGVIIKREGNTYTVLTAAHVVDTANKYEIVTSDGQRYSLNYSTKKQLPGVDLAVVQFTSSRNYTVAKMGNSDTSTEGTTAYVAGYPEPTLAINQSIYTFTTGDITANAAKALDDGYALVYSNDTKYGMSGGAVMNDKGELVGIHGRTDLDTKETRTGSNLGIPINTFLRLSATAKVDVGVSAPNTQVVTKPLASDFYIQGLDKSKKGDFKGGIADYTEAIRLNPKYAYAYNDRGIVRYYLGDLQAAIADFNQAIKINPNYANAYAGRSFARYKLKDFQGAIADCNQAIKINPNLALAYISRGAVRYDSGDFQAAIADFNQAIKINPNLALAYAARGLARADLKDKQGGIADLQKAADLLRQQGNTQMYQKAQELIKKFQQ
ncbi:MAG: tetratricopeptide repeat protein [Brasilonema octagenarum HA4186-MV1]|jgi:tetratricopeptide (TPR) repeat protein|nr:tetratricopeptide repeat protein [Brasilonema octagenarum HA4186-MV1]